MGHEYPSCQESTVAVGGPHPAALNGPETAFSFNEYSGRMMTLEPSLGILIGGSSHVGKSTLANELAAALGRDLISTDSLGRHPGRPWPSVLPQVAEYYFSLSDDTVHWFLKAHHENMWPRVRQLIEDYRLASKRFILEGAALRPEYVAQLDPGLITAVHLYADDDLLRHRMIERSDYERADRAIAAVIDKFIERSIRENREMLEAARAANIRCVDVGVPGSIDSLMTSWLLG